MKLVKYGHLIILDDIWFSFQVRMTVLVSQLALTPSSPHPMWTVSVARARPMATLLMSRTTVRQVNLFGEVSQYQIFKMDIKQ